MHTEMAGVPLSSTVEGELVEQPVDGAGLHLAAAVAVEKQRRVIQPRITLPVLPHDQRLAVQMIDHRR
ncbi:hypothetical protein [Nonomuraea sp. NEAU-A123]|uniref:hypothetical protein n=1 Tax=Nonomuraea sp. NEAU-A123 TaxID=2839649 RepID=UPI001BE48BA0|nr:hypothetical protein [Nonomuraea sp. NEAU-A123]MBT2234410.1 hypothetical protein [Nonomuraea sp. NEAU-A123]